MSTHPQAPTNGSHPSSEYDGQATITTPTQPAQGGNPSQQVPNQGGSKADKQQEYNWQAPINPAPAPAPNMNEILRNNGIRAIPGVTPGTCSTDKIEGQPNLPRLQNGPRVCSI